MTPRTRTALALCLTLLCGRLATAPANAQNPAPKPTISAKRPNFVFFLTDDQRADTLSIAGHPLLKTPNIDALARAGSWFQNAFVTHSLCAPSRSSFLTGMYSHSTGVVDNASRRKLKPGTVLVSDILRQNGYEVAFVGKAHIQNELRDHPWDDYFGFRGQGRYNNPMIIANKQPEKLYKGWMDDVLAAHAVDFLTRPHDKPFCLFVFFKASHRSWTRPERLAHLYEGQSVAEPPTMHTGYAGKPAAVADADMKIGSFPDVPNLDKLVKDYCATLAAIDENVGKILGALSAQHLNDDTAVVYSSDNGFFLGEWNFFDKRLMYEPSIRVPLIVRYPKLFPAGLRPTQLALHIDVAPTLLELAGIPIPHWMQGRSLVPILEGKQPPTAWRTDFLYEYYEYPEPHRVKPNRGVRTDRWKYIEFPGNPSEYELYDLKTDPRETTNLYGKPEFAPRVEHLRKRLLELRRETLDPDLETK